MGGNSEVPGAKCLAPAPQVRSVHVLIMTTPPRLVIDVTHVTVSCRALGGLGGRVFPGIEAPRVSDVVTDLRVDDCR